MISRRTSRFRALYDALPERVRHDADAAYARFAVDPNHSGLNFERIQGAKVPLSLRESTSSIASWGAARDLIPSFGSGSVRTKSTTNY